MNEASDYNVQCRPAKLGNELIVWWALTVKIRIFLLKRQVSQLTNVRISGCHCPCPLEISWVAPRILYIGKFFLWIICIWIYQACTTLRKKKGLHFTSIKYCFSFFINWNFIFSVNFNLKSFTSIHFILSIFNLQALSP